MNRPTSVQKGSHLCGAPYDGEMRCDEYTERIDQRPFFKTARNAHAHCVMSEQDRVGSGEVVAAGLGRLIASISVPHAYDADANAQSPKSTAACQSSGGSRPRS